MDTFNKDDSTVEIEAAKKAFGADVDIASVIEDFEMYGKFKVWLDPDKNLVNLTDMWRMRGRASQRPVDWFRLSSSKKFIDEFLTKIYSSLEVGKSHVEEYIQIRKGGSLDGKGGGDKSQGTYAHWQIAIEYARYLDKKFAIWANRVLRERFEEIKHPDVGKKKADRRHVAMKIMQRYNKKEITLDQALELMKFRDIGMDIFNEYKEALVARTKGRWPLINILSKTEKALTGKTARENKGEIGLEKGENYRNHLSSNDLFARMFVEKLSKMIVEIFDEDVTYGELSYGLDKGQDVIVGLLNGDPKYVNVVLDVGDRLAQIKKHGWKHPSARPRTSFNW